MNILRWLYNREFAIAPVVDWAWLCGVGMVAEMERHWSKLFVGDRFSFACNRWRNLFSFQEPFYRELLVEFFAIVNFEYKATNPNYNRALTFRLGGVY